MTVTEERSARASLGLATFRKVIAILAPAERRRGWLLLGLVVLMAMIQAAGVASVMPFLALLGNQELVHTNAALSEIYQQFGFISVKNFLFALGLFSFFVLILGSALRIFTHYCLHHYTRFCMHSVSIRLLETYLRQPYSFVLDRHSGDLAKTVTSEADLFATKALKPGLHLTAYLLVAVTLVTLLFLVDPGLAAIIATVIAGLYLAVFLSIKGLLLRMGRDRLKADSNRFKAATEAFGGIKDLKLLGREEFFLDRFRGPSRRNASALAATETLAEVPRYLVEAVGFGGVLLLALYLQSTRANLGEVLPILGMYAIAGYRLLPAAQHIYYGLTKLRFASSILDNLQSELRLREGMLELDGDRTPPIRPAREVVLESVRYCYPGTARTTLEDVNMLIRVGETVGLVGPSGAGKTTLVDLLLGLLRPTRGYLLVDGQAITDGLVRSWQATIGYVPQDIYLFDASVAENIALGIPLEQISKPALERAARMAQIHDFILGELENGYQTPVGERGIRLSGGQRQRLGIARALYHDPSMLVLDEATSALDIETERSMIDAISELRGEKTILIITHRISTLAGCDRLYRLVNGRVIEESVAAPAPETTSLAEGANGTDRQNYSTAGGQALCL